MSTAIIARADIDQIVKARNESIEAIDLYIRALNAANTTLTNAINAARASTAGVFGKPRSFDRHNTDIRDEWVKSVDAQVWKSIFERGGVKDIMDRKSIEEFETQNRADPVPITVENIVATIETLMNKRGEMFAQGVANCFSDLDRRFKSHDAFSIGSRIILTHVFDDWGCWNHSCDHRRTIADVERVFTVLDGDKPNIHSLITKLNDHRGRGLDPRQSEMSTDYLRIKCFKNGNAHLWFTRPDLVERVNKMLADFYGEVLPDGVDVGDTVFTSNSREVAKDLAFYWTPEPVGEIALRGLDMCAGWKILEPSAGEGHLVRSILKKCDSVTIDAVEYDAQRSKTLRDSFRSNVRVTTANFLKTRPEAKYDAVVMNPPFYRTHWMDHVHHAMKFLKPGGKLVAILPITARIGESAKHTKFRTWAKAHSPHPHYADYPIFRDLPLGSFKAAGTNVSTTVLTLKAKHA